MFKILIGVVIVAVGALVTFMVIDPNVSITSNNITQTTSVDTTEKEGYYTVKVEGEVSKPGSYSLEEGSTMNDLITAAGGITDYTDELAYIPTAELEGGQTYYIASKYDVNNICSLNEITKVNINTANVDALLEVSVFTTSIANSVVSYRTENGGFQTLEDLLEVYGIGNATYRKLRNYVTLHE